ncbi:MAG: T9SS-dependent M36 family metallopeptidase [Bacteroidia bacterium]
MKKIVLSCFFILPLALLAQIPQNTKEFLSLILSQNTGLKSTDLEEMKISAQSVDQQNGITHVYFNQFYKSIPIHNAVLGLHLDKDGKVVALNNTFVKNLEAMDVNSTPLTVAKDAALFAIHEKNNSKVLSSVKELEVVSTSGPEQIFKNKELANGDINVYLKWIFKDEKLKLTWNVNWLSNDGVNWWNIRVDAQTGKIIDENNWVAECQNIKIQEPNSKLQIANFKFQISNSPGSGEGTGEGKTGAKYGVLARPVESPSHGNHSLLTDPSDSLASPFSWHDDNGSVGNEYTITRGNNVFASDDKDNNNQPGYSPNGGTSLNFDFAFDKSKRHSDYLDAAITNLFYWNNLMHDVWYHYGFDDASGNFQANNYGRGGAASDEVNADAQDGSGTNNANFATPPDGQNPRMQMYVWNVSSTSFLLRVTEPTNIAKPYTSVQAAFGPKLSKTPIIANLILVNDGTSTPTLGCQTLTNGASISGQIALIDRGNCKFIEKVKFAQDKGAKAVIIINNISGNPSTMSGDGTITVTIPAIMISKADGDIIKNALKTGVVKGSLYDSAGTAGKQYDSDFDNGVICHEYGHGISNRLTGGPTNTDCLTNQEQMGEGWSDFFGLVMTHKPGDKGTDKHGIGTYVIDEANDGGGIRNYPYSTSLSINPVSYKDIMTFSVPHGVGSVWCSMLWDMYWDLIAKYGYDPDIYNGKGGNNMAMKLVIDGMKLQPCNPGFADGRDAILLADRLNNKGTNQELIWKAFARRGMGFGASQGSSNSRSDGTESFIIPKFDLPSITKTAVSEIENGDTLIYKIELKNINTNTIKQITLRDTLKTGLQFIKAEGIAKGSFSNPVYSAVIDSLKSNETVTCTIYTRVGSPTFTNTMEISDFESGAGNWQDSTLMGTVSWVSRANKKYKGTKSYFIINDAAQSDNVLTKSFNLNLANPSLVFYHFYNTETDWDGAVVEINKNGTWEDLGPLMVENGYNRIISKNQFSNISEQPAFSGNSGQFIRTCINLNPYKNDTVQIRFRFVSDGAQGGEGWYIDDVTLVDNLTLINNTARVNSIVGGSTAGTVNTLILNGEKVSITTPKLSGFKVSPNPFNDQIVVQSSATNYKLTLTDVLGKVVFQNNESKNTRVLETSNLDSGTYFLKIETAEGMDVIKLVK